MKKWILKLWVLCLVLSSCSHNPVSSHQTPGVDRLVFMLFDQMRSDYVDRYNLRNFKRLRTISTEYPNAYLGYMGSETVVSHAVIPAGLAPSTLPWQEDVFWDLNNQLGKGEQFHYVGGLGLEQYESLLKPVQTEFLPEILKKKFGNKVYVVGEKAYAALIMGARGADHIVTLKKDKDKGLCFPMGRAVPKSIAEDERFIVECKNTYGTEKALMALDGSRFVPGSDLAHQGGDVWTADAALKVMREEAWGSLFLTFGGIDKVSHIMGGHEGVRPVQTQQIETPYDLPAMLKIADEQLGKVLDELERQDLLKRTVIVVTSDHGGQTDEHFLGDGKSGWYGESVGQKNIDVNETVKAFSTDPAVRLTLQNTAVRVWTKSGAATRALEKKLQKIPGAIAIYKKNEAQKVYESRWLSTGVMSPSEKRWHALTATEILKNSYAPTSAHYFVLLKDGYGFDAIGDHGGAQERVQRVPLFVYSPLRVGGNQNLERTTHPQLKAKILELLPQ